MSGDMLSDASGSNRYYKAFQLNVDIGNEVLREVLNNELKASGHSLVEYMSLPNSQRIITDRQRRRVLHMHQVAQLNSPSLTLNEMDFTLLTFIILNMFTIPANDQQSVEKMRSKRNELVHIPSCELPDSTLFDESRRWIERLCSNTGDTFKEKVASTIQALENRHFVSRVCHSSKMKLIMEEKWFDLLKSEHNDDDEILRMKFGLAFSVNDIGRFLDVSVLAQELQKLEIINERDRLRIEMEDNFEEQASVLALIMMGENKEQMLKFCKCLRKMNPLVGKLVEYFSENPQLERQLHTIETEAIKLILGRDLVHSTEHDVSCAEIHRHIEDERKCFTSFKKIMKCLRNVFKEANYDANSCRVCNITWKNKSPSTRCELLRDREEESIQNMPSEKFKEYLGRQMLNITENVELINAVCEIVRSESISSGVFADFSDSDLEDTFKKDLEKAGHKYGRGIHIGLKKVRESIKQRTKASNSVPVDTFREFGKNDGDCSYKKGTVRCTADDLLTPAHCFVNPNKGVNFEAEFVVNLIKFALAYMNARQNGTIHFGIKPSENNEGLVVGVPKLNIAKVYTYIAQSLKHTLQRHEVRLVEVCLGPIHMIPVGDELFVCEVDIEPSSSFLREAVMNANFPPWGLQHKKCFIFVKRNASSLIEVVDQNKLGNIQNEFSNVFEKRKYEEMARVSKENDKQYRLRELVKYLTAGSKYVTDEQVPHIVSGPYSDCAELEDMPRSLTIMESAFVSSDIVFDFDSSTDLREVIEKDNRYFDITLAEEVKSQSTKDNSAHDTPGPLWLYCNGNVARNASKMGIKDWFTSRYETVNALIEQSHQRHRKRTLILIFVYQPLSSNDPLFHTALDCCKRYVDETKVISDSEENISQLKNNLSQVFQKTDVDKLFFFGYPWQEIATAISPIFKHNPECICKMPLASGSFAILTQKEKYQLGIRDIELVSGDECSQSLEEMDDDMRKETEKRETEKFYRGNEVSWWNFEFQTHVCERDVFQSYVNDVVTKINEGCKRLEIVEIKHQPGAGGTTLGRHLIWHLSQFHRSDSASAYRCCIVRNVTEKETADQISKFREYKEVDHEKTKTVIVFVDNESEEALKTLKDDLDSLAYRVGSKSGRLVCLLIVVTRVHISKHNIDRYTVLKQFLSQREKAWFQHRMQDLEQNANHEDIQSLIAFNVMKENFSDTYIQSTTKGIMEGLRPNEEKLLQHLSLINTFDTDAMVPKLVFDELLGSFASSTKKYSTRELKESQKPVGLADFCMQKSNKRQTWKDTESLRLLIRHRNNAHDKCIAIVSPLLANSILFQLMGKCQLSIENVVDQLLDYVHDQRNEDTNSSDSFTEIVCNLFNKREKTVTENGEEKRNFFSNLVLELDSPSGGETEKECHQKTNRLMKKCFDVSGDPYVEQQRARHCIHVHDFEEAKEAIQASIERLDKVPILYDTYGQVYKGELEFVLKNTDAAAVNVNHVINLATNAIKMFRKAQDLDQEGQNSSFSMEVLTALYMLEQISKLPCIKENRNMFLRFLNGQNTDLFDFILPQIEGYRKGNHIQCHVEESLLFLEYESTMKKGRFSEIRNKKETADNLRRLKDKFSCIYTEQVRVHGSITAYTYNSIKDAYHNKKTHLALKSVAEEVRDKVRRNYLSHPRINLLEHERELMSFVGFYIIKLSLARRNEEREDVMPDEEFKKLLSTTEVLVQLQRDKLHTERKWKPYIEPFMYIGLLHWPLPKRLDIHEEEICEPEKYIQILNEWRDVYGQRLERGKRLDQHRRGRSTTFFALANGPPGMDIVDQDMIKGVWRNEQIKEGRYRKEVKEDDIWNDPTYIRLKGVVDGTGNNIHNEVKHFSRKANEMLIWHFDIPTCNNCHIFRNRKVSFVLGFSWRGPVAYDVAEVQSCELLPESSTGRERETKNEVQTPTALKGRGQAPVRGFNETGGRGKSRSNVTLKTQGDGQKTASVSQNPNRQDVETGQFADGTDKKHVFEAGTISSCNSSQYVSETPSEVLAQQSDPNSPNVKTGQFADGTDEENVIAAASIETCYASQPVSETQPKVQAEQSGVSDSKKLTKRQKKNLKKKGK
ncbi:sterile alpha motif domain-containing protein 9-like isoform X2 [Mya arenaria]|uniref:sterile alpha motif domain-containing protein 9-like isoform X2 n=1 Tax=Mya arenaria TaxID=6604 RepID=UPI0022E28FFA|nr:sterile alpha motif domain-containing protein 9-like isoform X2 [Mya arenaria]